MGGGREEQIWLILGAVWGRLRFSHSLLTCTRILFLPNDVTVSSFPGSPPEYETSVCDILSLGRTALCCGVCERSGTVAGGAAW